MVWGVLSYTTVYDQLLALSKGLFDYCLEATLSSPRRKIKYLRKARKSTELLSTVGYVIVSVESIGHYLQVEGVVLTGDGSEDCWICRHAYLLPLFDK